jgi:two-component system chemotaxis response regulator CheY
MMKMLIAEDDFTCRLILLKLLKSYGTIDIALNGKEAVEATRIALENDAPYDLICLDILMPEMDGQHALKVIRNLEEAKGIFSSNAAKIMMITALDDLKNVSVAYHSLCDAYLTKPIYKAKLLEELRKLQLIII